MDAAIGGRLRPRESMPEIVPSFGLAGSPESGDAEIGHIREWINERSRAHDFQVDLIPFAELDNWSFNENTGNLGHSSRRFFTVEGLRVTVTNHASVAEPKHWSQPILNQPEVGILGFLLKDFNGVPHVLMQAKMEPGNRNLVQLSPTVQATRSNFTRVHGGTAVRYLDYFTKPGRGRILADVLQSEQGTWFYRKVNRNMIVEVRDDVEPHEDYRWLPVDQAFSLLYYDNVLSMDSRTVLACLPRHYREPAALYTDAEVLSWLTGVRAHYAVRADLIPLSSVPDWTRTSTEISNEHGRYFRIVAASVRATSRETTGWQQPLLEPCGRGVVCFLMCQVEGTLHVLVNARVQPGLACSVEIGPTVQHIPANYAQVPATLRPPFLDEVLSADPARIRYSAILSEEGGRFLHAENRYMLVTIDGPFETSPEYHWMTRGQLGALVRHGHYLNVEARTLLAVLNTLDSDS